MNAQGVEITAHEQIHMELLVKRAEELVSAGYTPEDADILASLEHNICEGTEKQRQDACGDYLEFLTAAEQRRRK